MAGQVKLVFDPKELVVDLELLFLDSPETPLEPSTTSPDSTASSVGPRETVLGRPKTLRELAKSAIEYATSFCEEKMRRVDCMGSLHAECTATWSREHVAPLSASCRTTYA